MKSYPELQGIKDDEPAAPKGNVIARNISLGGRWADYSDGTEKYLKIGENLILSNDNIPAIADTKAPTKEELTKTLANLKLPNGFVALPINQMGLSK